MESLHFSLSLKEQQVELDGKQFTIRELDGLQKGKYLNKMGGRVVLDNKGKVVGFKDYAGIEPSLLELCLFDSDNKLVSLKTIELWPSSVLGKLFEVAQELSGLGKKNRRKLEDEAKNF